MKKLLTIGLASLTLTACGPANVLNSGCGGELRPLCDTLFGPVDRQSELLDASEQQRLELERIAAEVAALQADVETQRRLIENLTLVVKNNQDLTELEIAQIKTDLLVLQQDLNDALVQIAELQGYTSVSKIIDPCGDGQGFDEVILLLTDGTYLAYFEDGPRRFLAALSPNNYQTTDKQKCRFTIKSDGSYEE